MRLLFIAVVLNFIFYFGTKGQSVNFGFNSTDSGRNITMQYEWTKGKNEFSFGLGFNFNKFAHNDDQEKLYKKRIYATKIYHRLNLDLTYQVYILENKIKNIHPFAFFDNQMKYSTTRNRTFIPFDYDSTLVTNDPAQGVIYRESIDYYGPFLWIENNVGLGFRADITERFYIKQRFGVGIDFILGHEDQILSRRFTWYDWEFSTLMHFSVGMRLMRRNS